MAFTQRLTFTIVLVILLASFPVWTIQASPVSVPTVNPNAEQYVQGQLLNGNIADLAQQFTDPNERVIGGEFLSRLLVSDEIQGVRSIVIRNAVITGDLTAELASLPLNISFDTCQFDGEINFIRAETGEFKIENSTVAGPLRMDRAHVHGDLVFGNSTFQGPIGLSEISVDGDLFGVRSQFLGTTLDANMDYPLELYRANVNLAVDFSDSHIVGKSIFDNSHVNEVYFTNTIFSDEANFNDAIVETNAMFEGTTFEGDANFNNFYTGNYTNFTDANFQANAEFDFSTSARFMDFVNTTFEQNSSFYYATAGWMDIIHVNFNGPVDFEGIHIVENFEINDSQYNYADEPFYFYLADIEGAVWLRNFKSPAGINASHGSFSIFEYSSDDTPLELQSLDVSASKIENELIVGNATLSSFFAQDLSVGQSTIFEQVNITDGLDLRNAKAQIKTRTQFLAVTCFSRRFWNEILTE